MPFSLNIEKGSLLAVNDKKIGVPKVGMRMIKSAVAVFICFLIHTLSGAKNDPFQSVIVAILCMQTQVDNSRKVAWNRIIGTIVGALVGSIVLIVESNFIPSNWALVRYAVIAFSIIPTIHITLLLKRPTASYLACVVLMSVTIIYNTDTSITGLFLFAYNRVLETVIGILVSLCINVIHLPRRREKEILLVTGLDDSIVGEDGKIGAYTNVELNHLIADGANITIATEKTPASLLSVVKEIKLRLPVIAMDGAVLFDTNEKRYLNCQAIPMEIVKKMCAILKQMDKHYFVNVVLEDVLLIFYGSFRNEVETKLYLDMRSSPYRNYVYGEFPEDGEVVYFLLVDTIQNIDDIESNIKSQQYSEQLLFLRDSSETPEGYCHLKIYHKNATKQFMLEKLKERLGITKTVVFGSNKNDIAMLESADLSIATEQAIPQAKEVSDYVLKKQDLDSVAKTMRKIYEPVIWQKGLQKPKTKSTLL